MGQPILLTDEELEGSEGELSRSGTPRPQRLRSHKTSRRTPVSTRQRPSNAAAKKGMHRRRNKRMAW
jgi:hypothetical protein